MRSCDELVFTVTIQGGEIEWAVNSFIDTLDVAPLPRVLRPCPCVGSRGLPPRPV